MKNFIILFLAGMLLACEKSQNQRETQTPALSVEHKKDPLAYLRGIKPASNAPDLGNMVLIQGGKIRIGSDEGWPNESPAFETAVKDFYLDQHPVTVAEFRQFIQATHYRSDAEKFGDAGVFDFENQVWRLVKGATWEYPQGPDEAKAKDDHPVTQVSWRDAEAYCFWASKRLPTEIEWEYAARNGKNNDLLYSWGNERDRNGKYLTNVWQGNFPQYNTAADGYLLTSPVGQFGKNELGLSDMGGNVWQWCADTYHLYPGNSDAFEVNDSLKTQRGGSFMCDYKSCHAYRVSGRGSCSWETSLFHVGFRCAADVKN